MTDDPQTVATGAGQTPGGDYMSGVSRSPSDDPTVGEGGQPSEEQLRAAYEAELNRITTSEMMLQTAVSLLNLGAHRLGLAGGAENLARDLEQVRDAIDGVRALMPILERRMPNEIRPLRDALAQLQMAFAREANAEAGQSPPGQANAGAAQSPPEQPPQSRQPPAGSASAPSAEQREKGPGPAQASGRLWVPGR
jgi:hypothetical protein